MFARRTRPAGLRYAVFLGLVLSLILVPSIVVAATAGDLDPWFGTNGEVIVDLGGPDLAYGLAIDSDQRIVVAGQAVDTATGQSKAGIVRLLPDGSLDQSFGAGGIARISVGGSDFAYALDVGSDGKIVVGGSTADNPTGANGDYLVFRLNEDGSLDGTFGTGGAVAVDFGASEGILDIALQPDGRIVAGGQARVLRFTAQGALDPTFGVGGVTDLQTNANRIDMRPNGQIVVAAHSQQAFRAQQLEPDGSIDQGFGIAGIAEVDFGTSVTLRALALQPDGKVLMSGSVNVSVFNVDFGLGRLNSDGSVDASFGVGGIVLTDIGVGDSANGIALQADGKIVAGGTVATAFTGRSDIGLARYLADGTLDTSFGNGGTTLHDFGKLEFPWKLAIQSDGMFVVAGTSTTTPGRTDANYQVVRFLATADVTPPEVIGFPDRPPNLDGWYNAPVDIDWQATDDSGTATDAPNTLAANDGADVIYTSEPSCDPSGNCATGSLVLSIDQTPPTVASAELSTSPSLVSTATTLTLVGADSLSGVAEAEFFVDLDPGPGLGTSMLDTGDSMYAAALGDELPAGVYVVGARVRDLAGNWSDAAFKELVVYDPGAGFVTGGGWFESPRGSAPAEPEAFGGTSFGLSSKYKKEAATPSGQLELQFQSADINFHSTSLEWMVVAGNVAIIEAVGTINGDGLYSARVWIGDDPDEIRVKLWWVDEADVELTVYDAGDRLPLQGGAIAIHAS